MKKYNILQLVTLRIARITSLLPDIGTLYSIHTNVTS